MPARVRSSVLRGALAWRRAAGIAPRAAWRPLLWRKWDSSARFTVQQRWLASVPQSLKARERKSVHEPEVAPKEQYDLLPTDLFRQAAGQYATRVALDGPAFQMTYAELDSVTDSLAAFLREKYRAVPETVVGIYMERCEEYVIAMLAIWKSGAAYCPIELAYPAPLRQAVIDEVEPLVVLTKGNHAANLPTSTSQFVLDDGWQQVVEGTMPNVEVLNENKATLESLSYVIYSGGTTGRPKGIEAPFRSNTASYLWRNEISGYQPGARVGCNVFFVWEIIRPLFRGGTTVVIPDDIIFDTASLAPYLQKKNVTEVLFTPSLFETLLRTIDVEFLRTLPLQVVWLNGEVVTTKLLQQAREIIPDVLFCNTYSISECGEVCSGRLDADREDCPKFCPVGKSAAFAETMFMDTETLEPVAKGETGELWVSGRGVGRGYTKNPKKTAEVFVEYQGTPWYRTGDLARELHDGVLEILGRCDYMVKVRGYSIVLGAVESAIRQTLGVAQCCVVAKGEEGTDKRLAAYIVPCEPNDLRGRFPLDDGPIDDYGASPILFQELLKELPHYAVPSVYVTLEEMPLNQASMKANRNALPPLPTPPPAAAVSSDFRYDGSEAAVQFIFEEVLSLPANTLSPDANFFEFGGHSLLVTQLLARVAELGGPRLAVVDFVSAPTPAGFVAKARGETIAAAPPRFLPTEVDKYVKNLPDLTFTTQAFWRYNVFTNSSQAVLLTGATGYVGVHILARLLKATGSSAAGAPGKVFCVVRVPSNLPEGTDPNAEARARVTKKLQAQGHTDLDLSRLEVLAGDMSLHNFGLNVDEYSFLQHMLDVVIHTAATVNLTYNYDLLEGANVHGTQHAIDFARGGKMKALHYISTDAVFPESGDVASFDEQGVPPHHLLHTGYAQTKWVAEQFVVNAGTRGLPVAIYRLGNVAGPVQGSGWNDADSNLLFMRSCLDRGVVPEGSQWSLEMTPVDFVADFVVSCSMDLKFSSSKIFNLINSSKMSMEVLASVASEAGYPIRRVGADDWCDGVADAQGLLSIVLGKPALTSLLGLHHKYGQDNVQAACAHFGKSYPVIGTASLSRYIRRLVGERLLPAHAGQSGKLEGQVALVTGACNGIGMACAKALAVEGANVVMVMDKTGELESNAGNADALECDVTSSQSVHSMMVEVERRFRKVDIVVNAAGLATSHPEDWATSVNANCMGIVNVCGAALPVMQGAKTGHMVNISSVFPSLPVFKASNAFVNTYSRDLRAECVGTGLRVTDIQPGAADTNGSIENQAQDGSKGREGASILDPEDVASAVLYAVTAPSHVGVRELVIEPRYLA